MKVFFIFADVFAFEAQAAIDATTSDDNLECHFLAKCGVDAISKLQNLLFPLLIENNDCTFAHVKAAIKHITGFWWLNECPF